MPYSPSDRPMRMMSWYDDARLHAQASLIAAREGESKQVTFGRLMRYGLDFNEVMDEARKYLNETRLGDAMLLAEYGSEDEQRAACEQVRSFSLYPPPDIDVIRWIRSTIEDKMGRPIVAPAEGEYAGPYGVEVRAVDEEEPPLVTRRAPHIDDQTAVVTLGSEAELAARVLIGDQAVSILPEAHQVFVARGEKADGLVRYGAVKDAAVPFVVFGSPDASCNAVFVKGGIHTLWARSAGGEIHQDTGEFPCRQDVTSVVVQWAGGFAVRVDASGISVHATGNEEVAEAESVLDYESHHILVHA